MGADLAMIPQFHLAHAQAIVIEDWEVVIGLGTFFGGK